MSSTHQSRIEQQEPVGFSAKNASLALLATAIGQINEAIIITDTQATIQYVNPAFTVITGYSAEEAVGQNTRLLKSERQDPAYYQKLWRTIAAGEVWRGELINRRKNGTFYTEQMSITPVRDRSGTITNFIAIKQDVSKRRATEEELRLAQFSLEHASDGVYWLDPQARIVYVNEGACRSLGYSREEFLALSIPDIDPLFPRDVWTGFWEDVKKQSSKTFETQQRTKQGRVFPAEITANYVEFDGQEYIFAFARDISERKLTEQSLQRSEEKFRQLAENIREVFWMMSPAGDEIVYVSPAYEQVWGRKCDDLYQNPMAWAEAIHPDDLERAHSLFARQMQGERIESEYRIQTPDGQEKWISDRAFPVRDKDGKIIRVVGIAEETTKRKHQEKTVRDSEKRYRLLFERNLAGVFRTTLDGRVLDCNEAAAGMFGYESAAGLRGILISTVYDAASDREAVLSRLKSEKRLTNHEIKLRRRDGVTVWAMVNMTLVEGGDAGADGTIEGTFVDVTERKRAEEEMRKAKEAAESANRAKSQFLANMSHEIRTPMNGVIGVAGLLLDTALTAEQRQYAELVRVSGEALLTVINDILDFSKIEARKLTLETTDFDLRTVMENAANVLAIKASEKGLALACELKPGTPRLLRGDPGRLRQILVNLLGNAVKFTQRGGVSIWVNLEAEHGEAEDSGSARLRFNVTDTGIGFAQENASALFEPFVQGDGSSTRRYGGTGLGLTISKQLIELMGGRIGVESKEGKGSTFWFTAVFEKQPEQLGCEAVAMTGVKASLAAAVARPRIQSSSTIPATVPVNRQARILLAEDNAVNQAVAVAMLTKLGYHADLVSNGVEALHALRQGDYDLVLMDCGMPEMDGYEATRRIRDCRAGTRNPLITIVALTADAMSGDRDKCLAAGMNDYVAKPVEVRKLGDMLEKWLQPSGASQANSPTDQMPAEVEAVFNFKQLLARLMGDQDLAGKVIAAFLDDAPKQLRTLKKMLDEGDADGARRQAHTLKGAAATLSAEALRALCAETQEAATAKDLSRAATLLLRMQEQFELLQTTLQQSGWV